MMVCTVSMGTRNAIVARSISLRRVFERICLCDSSTLRSRAPCVRYCHVTVALHSETLRYRTRERSPFYCAFQLHADPKIQSSTDKCVFRYRQSTVRRLLPASDFCGARAGAQR